MVTSYIDDECEWINDVVCCKKCKEPVHIAFFHDEPVSFCPKCGKMYYYPYSKEMLKRAHLNYTQNK
jgi:rRNA maturation endonuclease Nob1